MADYSKTIEYWDKTFSERQGLSIGKPLPYPELEAGLAWLCESAEGIVDFGCGRGTLLLRCLSLGARRAVGIDLSPRAVSLVAEIAKSQGWAERGEFVLGDVSTLKAMHDRSFDGAILSNIIDNLFPEDARAAMAEIKRLIKPEGKLFLKLNDYRDPSYFRDNPGCRLMAGQDFYQEPSGLYFWNLSEDAVRGLVEPQLEIEKFARVEFREYKVRNRLYLLRKVA